MEDAAARRGHRGNRTFEESEQPMVARHRHLAGLMDDKDSLRVAPNRIEQRQRIELGEIVDIDVWSAKAAGAARSVSRSSE